MAMQWYVVQAYSGLEKRVKEYLQTRIKQEKMESLFGDILVPSEEVMEIRSGKKYKGERKFYPGYVLVHMEMNDDTWYLVSKTPKVRGFIGGSSEQPCPLSEKEANEILSRVQEGAGKAKPKVLFEPGEVVRVIDGPFADFTGAVEEVNYEKNRLRVAVLIFGRSTPVDLDFSQVEKG